MTMNRLLATSSAGTLLAATLAFGAHAQPATNGPSATTEEVVVTAQKRSENVQKVPITIQALSAKQIEKLSLKSSSDLVKVASNLEFALQAGAGNSPIVTIRGIGLNDFNSNNAGPNGIYDDEVYLSSPASQTFSTFDLQRIEVLKGPQGTLYGRNASGGAINFISNQPTDYLTGNLHAEYSSFNTVNVEGAVGGRLLPDLDGRFAFVKNNSDGYVNNSLTGQKANGANNGAVRLMLRYQPTDKFKVLFNLHAGWVDNLPDQYWRGGAYVPGSEPGAPALCAASQIFAGGCVDLYGNTTPSFHHANNYRREHLKANNLGTSLRADYTLGSITYTSITAFEHLDRIDPDPTDAGPIPLLSINFGVRSNEITQEFRASQTKDRYNWVAGGYFLHEDLRQNQPLFSLAGVNQVYGPGAGAAFGAFNAFDQSHQVTNAVALYGQGDYAVTDKLKLTLGGRLTQEKKTFDYLGTVQFQDDPQGDYGPIQVVNDSSHSFSAGAFSWRAVLNYSLTKDILTYASAATGFKSGGFNGGFLSLDPAQASAQLKAIKPENVIDYEVGIKSSFLDRRLTFDLTAFYNDYRNMQVFVLVPQPFPIPAVNALSNAKSAHTEGLDIEADARPFPGLTVSSQIGLLDTAIDANLGGQYVGNQLALAPHTTASVVLDYTHSIGPGKIDFTYDAAYKGNTFEDVTEHAYMMQRAYWLQDVRVAYQLNGGKWEVAAYVHNLEDKKYFSYISDLTFIGIVQGIYGTPRTVGVEANYHF